MPMPRRIIIVGGPRVGKTTLSKKLIDEWGISTLHTSQDLERLFPANQSNGENWSKSSEYASKWFDEEGDWICEGVQMARGLRKWLLANPGKQLDADIFLLRQPMVPQLDGQKAMMKGVETVFREIEHALIKRGARVHKLKDPKDAIEVLRSAVPINPNDAEAVPMALKRKLTKEEFDKLSDAHKELYSDPGNNGNYVLDAEPDEDTGPLKTALEREKATAAAAKKAADELAAKYKDVDPEKYQQLIADAEERTRESKKKSGDWEGWKASFEEQKTKEINALKAESVEKDKRIRKFLLEDKVRIAALENGVRKESVARVVRDLLHPDSPRFRLDDKEQIEVLDDKGSPMDVKLDSFFKDIYLQEASEFYVGSDANGGSGASNNDNGSRGGARVVSATDQAALNANIEKIAKGEITVQA